MKLPFIFIQSNPKLYLKKSADVHLYCIFALFCLFSSMIPRDLTSKILALADKFPVISVTGPRQAGKTTLIKNIFPKKTYFSLEDPDIRLVALEDPRKFLETYPQGLILDEVQRTPELFSYIQTIVDKTNMEGMYILSGSQSFLLSNKISQSLAGRVGILNLLPLSMAELSLTTHSPQTPDNFIFKGGYPRIYDKNIDPMDFFPNYVQTYIERDVRQLQNVHNLDLFTRFLKLCAGRVGQLLNLTNLANECGISVNTARSWLSVLETSYILFLLKPHHQNFNKRLIKMPKLYFYDTGLLCYFLGLESESQSPFHYLHGEMFENLIIAEIFKFRIHQGQQPSCFFWRDSKGNEIDCLLEWGTQLIPLEIKSTRTMNPKFWRGIQYWEKLSGQKINSAVIYGGDNSMKTEQGQLISWKQLVPLLSGLSILK